MIIRCAHSVALFFALLAMPAFAQGVTVSDQRDGRPFNLVNIHGTTPLNVLDEDHVDPIALRQLETAFATSGQSQMDVVVTQLWVIDFYPRRMRAGVGSLLVNANTDWDFVNAMDVPRDQDSILFILAGTVNGKPFKVAAHRPYKISAFALLIRKDKSFRAAVTGAIGDAASQVAAMAGGEVNPQSGVGASTDSAR
jgi:hypothetical protein